MAPGAGTPIEMGSRDTRRYLCALHYGELYVGELCGGLVPAGLYFGEWRPVELFLPVLLEGSRL